MDGALKTGVVLLVLVFIGFYLVTDPSGFGRVAKDGGVALWDLLVQLFEAFISFLNTVFS